MTAKQKANRERFKKVVAEAKKLRSKNPKLSQAQAVKQSWAIMYSKTGTSKKVGAVKKKTAKKVSKKKAAVKSYHKDTKSHNVNIRVISGINENEFYVNKLKNLAEELHKANKQNELLKIEWKKNDKNFKERNANWKKHWPIRIKMLKKMIAETKKHIK